jgi:hypothetical protein
MYRLAVKVQQEESSMKPRLPIILGLFFSAGLVFGNAAVAQEPAPPVPPIPASEAPITVTLQTVIGDMAFFAGQRVRIPEVRVRDVISPRAVLVETGNMPTSGMRDDPRVLLVLDKPVSNIARGAILEVVAQPWIYAEAVTRVDRAILDEVEKEHEKFKRKPILTAESVRTVGGLEVSSLR